MHTSSTAIPTSLQQIWADEFQQQVNAVVGQIKNVENAEIVGFDSSGHPIDDYSPNEYPQEEPSDSDLPHEGFNSQLHAETRRTLGEQGLLPLGPPAEPAWKEYVSPEATCPTSTPDTWRVIDFRAISLDPFFASIVGPWIRAFPSLVDIKLPLPNSASPHISYFPGLLLLPTEILLYQIWTHKQTDRRLCGPELIEAPHDHPLITWYRQVWNLHCANRQFSLVDHGYQTDWNWASGFFPRANQAAFKENFGENLLMEGNRSEVAVRYGKLLKGFAKMPRAMAKLGVVYHPKPQARRARSGRVHRYDESHYL